MTTKTARVMAAKFAGLCKSCGLYFPVNTPIIWTPGVGAIHSTPAGCDAAKAAKAAAPAAPVVTIDMKPMADFLMAAKAKLKFPKALFLTPNGGELKLYVAGTKSKFPGSIQVLVNDQWQGRITPEGDAHGRGLTGNPVLVSTLTAIAADPAKAAAAFGALRGACSFCNKGLSDDGSLEVGYGPVCAKNYNLPWKRQGVKVLTTAVEAAVDAAPLS